jgi:hypothetical protein
MIEPQHMLTQDELQDAINLIVDRANELGVAVSVRRPKSKVVVYTADGIIPFADWMER